LDKVLTKTKMLFFSETRCTYRPVQLVSESETNCTGLYVQLWASLVIQYLRFILRLCMYVCLPAECGLIEHNCSTLSLLVSITRMIGRYEWMNEWKFLFSCRPSQKLTESQFSPAHAWTRRRRRKLAASGADKTYDYALVFAEPITNYIYSCFFQYSQHQLLGRPLAAGVVGVVVVNLYLFFESSRCCWSCLVLPLSPFHESSQSFLRSND